MMSAALWKEAEGSNEVVTDLTGGKSQHSQQGLTGKWGVPSPLVQGTHGGSEELEPQELSKLVSQRPLPGQGPSLRRNFQE